MFACVLKKVRMQDCRAFHSNGLAIEVQIFIQVVHQLNVNCIDYEIWTNLRAAPRGGLVLCSIPPSWDGKTYL